MVSIRSPYFVCVRKSFFFSSEFSYRSFIFHPFLMMIQSVMHLMLHKKLVQQKLYWIAVGACKHALVANQHQVLIEVLLIHVSFARPYFFSLYLFCVMYISVFLLSHMFSQSFMCSIQSLLCHFMLGKANVLFKLRLNINTIPALYLNMILIETRFKYVFNHQLLFCDAALTKL